MIKKIWMILIVLMCVFPASTIKAKIQNEIIENDETGIPDNHLYKEILSSLGKNENEKITKWDAEFLSRLYVAYGNEIETFKGLGNFKRLEEIICRGINTKDLEEIAAELPYLKKLTVNGYDEDEEYGWMPPVEERKQKIDSIACLENMQNLIFLDVSDNNLTSLDGIVGLANLKTLNAGKNRITEIKQLENLWNLKKLELYSNQLKNLNGIQNLTKLTYLNLSDNQLTNLKGMNKLTKLSCLGLSGNRLKNVKEIKNLKNLKKLSLNENQLQGIGEMKKLEKLKELYISENKLKNIKGVQRLKNLQILYLSENRIANADEIKYLKKLEYLSLSGNRLKKLPEMKKLKKLQTLRASDNELKKLPDLKQMNVMSLNLNWNYLTEEEIKSKLPKSWHNKYIWESQKTNIKIQYLSPKNKTKITKNTKKITGKITPAKITGITPGVYLALPDGEMAGWDGEMASLPKIEVYQNGRFRIKRLNLKKYAGKEIELKINIDYDIGNFTIDRFVVQE